MAGNLLTRKFEGYSHAPRRFCLSFTDDAAGPGAKDEAFAPAPGADERRSVRQDPDVNPEPPIARRRSRSSPVLERSDSNAAAGVALIPFATISASEAYAVDPPQTRAITGFAAGVAGATPVVIISYAAFWINANAVPSFIASNRAVIGTHSTVTDHLFGTIVGLVVGGMWGALFGWLIRRPTVMRGVAFGFVPTLCTWLVLALMAGRGSFSGFHAGAMLLPALLNMAVWGAIVGRITGQWLRPPSQ